MRASKMERGTSFATFMDRSGPSLLRIAWFLTGDADHAQELTQAAFVKTYLVWSRTDHDRALPDARRCLVNHKIDVWRAAHHHVADHIRAQRELPSGSSESGSPSPGGAMATIDHRDDLVRRLSRLPEEQRKVLVLRYYADQSEVSVAGALGVSVGAVKSATSLGLLALRHHAEAQTQTQKASSSTEERPAMPIDLEGDLRREFNASIPPGSLMFHPESIVREGNRIIRRRWTLVGSAAMAVALVAAGVGLLNRPEGSATPPPAPQLPTPTATSAIARSDAGFSSAGVFQLELNPDAKVTSNVKLFIKSDDGRREVAAWSTPKLGQKPDATWKSGMVDGSPFTVGLFPGTEVSVKLADGASYGISSGELKGTGYSIFFVSYKNGDEKEPARPARIARISWSGPTGIVDGIEGNRRLTGQILAVDTSESVKVLLRPGDAGRVTVFGSTSTQSGDGSAAGTDLSAASTDPSGVAVLTGRMTLFKNSTFKGRDMSTATDGSPVAAGILPPGASDVGVILTTNEEASGLPALKRLPDGRVIFAMKAQGAQPSNPGKDSIKAVTWTNADGTKGRKNVTQQAR